MLPFSIRNISILIRSGYALTLARAIGFIAAMLVFGASSLQAQQLTSGSSGRQFRQQALESVPFQMLTQQTREKIQPTLEKPSIYRRLPKMAIECDPDYFRFLVRHPEVIVEIWKLMGVTKMTTTRTGPYQLASDDGAGTVSDLELVYGDGEKHIFFGTGSYEGPLIRRKMTGRCVLVLQTQHVSDEYGKPKAVSQLDVFLRVDNVAAGMIARTLQPLVGPTADHNFMESMKFVQKLYGTTLRNGQGVQLMGERLDIQPDVLRRFQQAAGIAYERGVALQSYKASPRVSSSVQTRSFRSR
jgi:hypothetical protein